MSFGLKASAIALGLLLAAAPRASHAQVGISITIAPPVLPVYAQPPCPQPGYMWMPGYWAWGPDGYYWVPGAWVAPPRAGLLWTPGYWGFARGAYIWHAGYWGPHVGFYGGVNYGFGYGGVGFAGGVWAGNVFRYNTAVVNVDRTVVRNVYVDRTVVRNTTVVNRVSYNGGGGIQARPTTQDQMAMREQHFQPTGMQRSHEQMAARDRNSFASVNHGRPGTMAMDSINGRRFGQQERIANGVATGRLNANQTRRLEGRQANVDREIRNDRQANGGQLTPRERGRVNRQQQNLNRAIYNDKHNGRANERAAQHRKQEERRER